MMKAFAILALFLALPTWAENPLIRICRTTGGTFHEVQIPSDSVAMCQYGSALITSLSILKVTSSRSKCLAVQAFEKSNGTACETAGGELVSAVDAEGATFSMCLFHDGSMIESQTLELGPSSENNQGLVQALQTQF